MGYLIAIGIVITFVLGVIVIRLHNKRVMKPLKELRKSMSIISNGGIPKELDINRFETCPKEICKTIEQFNMMIDAIHEQKQALTKLAKTDTLTGMANRRMLSEQLQHEWNLAKQRKLPLSLAFLDVDLFKEINDYFGHQIGDQCLKEISQIIHQSIQSPKEFVARYGGEEFIIILPGTNIREATFVAEKIRQRIEQLTIPHIKHKERYMTVSIGVTSLVPSQKTDKETLIKLADQALYEAKSKGRNKVIAKVL